MTTFCEILSILIPIVENYIRYYYPSILLYLAGFQ